MNITEFWLDSKYKISLWLRIIETLKNNKGMLNDNGIDDSGPSILSRMPNAIALVYWMYGCMSNNLFFLFIFFLGLLT